MHNITNDTVPYVTIAYGNPTEWALPFRWWLLEYKRVIGNPLHVVSQGEPWVKAMAEEYPDIVTSVYEVDVTNYKFQSILNPSGMLLAWAAQVFSPCMIVTLDCELITKPEIEIINPAEKLIALGDHFNQHRWHKIDGIDFKEYNCAVQWCGAPLIGRMFIEEWNRLCETEEAKKWRWYEQIVWSWVYHLVDEDHKVIYPDEWSWSARQPVSRALKPMSIIHHHGRSKNALWEKWRQKYGQRTR